MRTVVRIVSEDTVSEHSEQQAPRAASSPVPAPVVERLPGYLSALRALAGEGRTTVSSVELAAHCGVGSAVLRRDLSHLPSVGRRGVGYDIPALSAAISGCLGLTAERRIAIAGAGRLGSAIADYAAERFPGFALAAVFDTAEAVLGTEVGGIAVSHISTLPAAVAAHGIELLIIAVPADAAQQIADAAAAAGITGLLNFAPVVLSAPPGVHVRRVDVASELQVLAHYTAAAGTSSNPREHAL